MASELLPMFARGADANNDVLAGALFYFYATGTTTPQAVYTTSALSVAHANPVVADAGGKFDPIYMDASLTYRGVLKTAAGATIFDFDPINTGDLSALAASGGSALVGFLQAGSGAVARTTQAKLREAPMSAEDYGAVGDNSTDDTAAIAAALAAADAADGGTVQLTSGRTYKTTAELAVPSGVRFNLNESRIRAVLNGGDDAAVSLRSNSIVENGHIEVDSTGSPGTGGASHAPIRVGSRYGAGGTVASPATGDSPSGWVIRNMIVESDKYVLSGGSSYGAPGIQVIGGATNGLIENITVPDNAQMAGAIHCDWGYLGTLASTATFANMTTNRTNFDAGTAYTTHPNNITIRNVNIGNLTATATGVQDIGSRGVRLSGVYNVKVENVTIEGCTLEAFAHTAGDLGFEFAQAAVKPLACKNIVFENCSANGQVETLAISDSLADNVRTASRTAVFTADIAGTTLTVSAVASGTLAVGHSVYRDDALVGVISALGTGVGGTGTYTLTGAVTTSSTTLNSGYGWLLNPFHDTNIVFERVTGRGSGAAGAGYGIRIIQQRGGTIRNCDVSYFLAGVNVDENVRDVTIDGVKAHFNRQDGIYIHHGTYLPTDITVRDCVCHDNGQDTAGYSTSAGIRVEGSKRVTIDRGSYGRAGAYDPTQRCGIIIASGALDTVLRDPYLRSGRSADGVGLVLISGTAFNQIGLVSNPRYETAYLLLKYSGTTAVPVAKHAVDGGTVNTVYSVVSSATDLTGLSLKEGDELLYQTIAPGGVRRAAAVVDGNWETAGVVQPVGPIRGTSAYTVTNGTTDRAYDADTVVVAELADIVATLIEDLKTAGVLS